MLPIKSKKCNLVYKTIFETRISAPVSLMKQGCITFMRCQGGLHTFTELFMCYLSALKSRPRARFMILIKGFNANKPQMKLDPIFLLRSKSKFHTSTVFSISDFQRVLPALRSQEQSL